MSMPMELKEQERRVAIACRSQARRARIVSFKASDFADAERWDLEYWQAQGPVARLVALTAIQADVLKAQKSRGVEDGRHSGL
ncbi:MAG: hypothetical protein U1E27_11300 [Kiritimatiellia bacterium]|nr:hypothetical protein [Kiritimatiellia bacterium]